MYDAAMLADDIRKARPFRDLSAQLSNLDTAFDLQDAVTQELARNLGGFAGYKISWNTAQQQKALGLPHPGMGRVFRDQLAETGAYFRAKDYCTLAIEPEFIARIGAPLGSGATEADAAAAIASVHIGFELLERRQVPASPDIASVIATNVFNAGLVIGASALSVEELSKQPRRSWVALDAEVLLDQENAAPEPPARAVAFLADHFGRRGQPMKAGDLVLCGAHLPPFVLLEKANLTFSLTGFDDVTMSFG